MTRSVPSPFHGTSSRTHPAGELSARRPVSARRKLQLALGVIWLIDAALQYQPYMFGRAFVTQTIEPAATGTPGFVEHPALWAAHLMIHHITLDNAVFASIQLLIALALFYRPAVEIGLAVSIAWAVGIWWLAEGIGGVTLGVPPVGGAPGAAILYALIALLVWPRSALPPSPPDHDGSIAERGAIGRTAPKVIWVLLWWGFAALSLENVNRSPSALHDMVTGTEAGEPGWIKAIDRALAAPLAHHGTEVSIGLAVLYGLVGAGVLGVRTVRPAAVVAILVGAALWLAEDFGGMATGSGTDVNSGPLLVLLAACFWPLADRAPDRSLTPRRVGARVAMPDPAVADSVGGGAGVPAT